MAPNVQKKSYLYFYPSYLDFKARTVSGCLSIRKMAATDRCANCGFKMTAFGRPPLWIVVFYSVGGFKLSSPSCFGLLTQKCGSYVIDSAKGDGRGGGAEVAKMERTGGEREPVLYAAATSLCSRRNCLISTPGRHGRESRTGGRQLIAFVVEKKISACVNYFLKEMHFS